MKNFVKCLGIIAIVAVIGFSMVACDDDGNGGGSSGGDPGGNNPNGGAALPAPTGVTAVPGHGGSIVISWNKVTGAAGYFVYRSLSSSGPWIVAQPGWVDRELVDSGLEYNTTYYYYVTARDSDWREGSRSSIVSATTNPY